MKRIEDRLWCSLEAKRISSEVASRAVHHLSDSERLLGYCNLVVEVIRITQSQSSDNSSVA